MEEKKKTSAAQMRATEKYKKLHYDRILYQAPAGMKEKIKAAARPGESVNAFINDAIRAELERREGQEAAQP